MTHTETVILVEGESDRNAVVTLATRMGRDLTAEGVDVLAMGGAAGFADHLNRFENVRGLCDVGEVPDLVRALEMPRISIQDIEQLGFYVCVRDLEEEMIRANGTDRVLGVIDNEGETRTFERFQLQPEWRARPIEDQLRRFLGTRGGRKVRFGRLLAESVDLDQIPGPLRGLLESV